MTITASDYSLMRRVNRWSAPLRVRWWMLLATRARFRAIEAAAASMAAGIQFSFPSGHSSTAFAVAMSLGSFYPEIMPVLLLALNVAVARVIVGMHFLSDVVVGSGTGALLGYNEEIDAIVYGEPRQ